MTLIRNTYSMLLGNPEAERHLDLFVDIRIILKWVVRVRNCIGWWRWRFAVAVTGFWALRSCRLAAGGEETNWCASGRHLFMLGVQRHTPAVTGHATQRCNLFNDSASTA